MTGQETHTEIELEIGPARLKVSGSEDFVREVLSKPNEFLASALDALTKIGAPAKRGAERKKRREGSRESPETAENWQSEIAADSGISIAAVDDIYQYEDNKISVHDWPIAGSSEETFQEIALLVMYANRVLTGENDITTRKVTSVIEDLGLDYNHRLIGGQLTSHAGISSPRKQWLRINTRGRNDAKQLLIQRELELGST
ncbi:MAG: hypothetical protein ACFFER_06150 [Candidatus Thorarchaeota archaeon]